MSPLELLVNRNKSTMKFYVEFRFRVKLKVKKMGIVWENEW